MTPKAELARHEPTGETPSPRSRRPVTFFESGGSARHARLPARRPARGLRVRGPGHRRAVRLDRRRPAGLAGRGRRVAEHPTARLGGCAMSTKSRLYTLDPVTFEVLKNAFTNTVDQMAEQILRTCHSFVIFARDFSLVALRRRGQHDHAGHRRTSPCTSGTLHYTCKAVIEAFEGDIHPGDVFAINDPYLGGTHFNDVRIIRPIFVDGEVIAYAQSNGHWADVGGTRPRLVRHQRQGALRRGPAHPADPHLGRGQVPRRHRAHDRLEHARARHDHRRPAGAGRGDARGRARDPPAGREVRQADDHDGVQRGAGLRRDPHPPAHRRDARRRLGDRGLHRLRPVDRRGPDPDQGQDDDRGRPAVATTSRARIRRSARSSTPASAARSRA